MSKSKCMCPYHHPDNYSDDLRKWTCHVNWVVKLKQDIKQGKLV